MTDHAQAESPRSLSPRDFPIDGSARERLCFLLRYAILAPSTHNTQPWRFAIGSNRILVLRDRSRWLQVADPSQRELHISVGCALEALLIAARAFGYRATVTHFPGHHGADCVASVELPRLEKPQGPRGGLLEAMTRRQTARRPFRPRAVPVADLGRLEAVCGDPRVMLHLTDDRIVKRRLEALVADADARLFAEPAYRDELGRWLGEGTFGTSWLLSKLGQIAVTYLHLGGSTTARHDTELLHSAPEVGMLATRDDDRVNQVRVGQQFMRICLQAELCGLGVQPMSQLCQVEHVRAQLGRYFAAPDARVQMVFRVGYPEVESAPMPRRPLEEVLG
ncbi:MAG: nitroreductase [Gammaproteobacteria bacterium]|nr:nitroreductase [Gammaproteobacteria bacterium]